MADSSATTIALESLSQAIYYMNAHAASAPITPTARTPLIDPYNTDTTLNLYYRAEKNDYANACAPLSKP